MPFKRLCPPVVAGVRVGVVQRVPPVDRSVFSVNLLINNQLHSVKALVDSGADQNFIQTALARKLGVSLRELEPPLLTSVLNGTKLSPISQVSEPVILKFSGNHVESISFFAMDNSHVSLVLGLPWLQLHNPHINWRDGSILSWSSHCMATCLSSAHLPVCAKISDPDEDIDVSNVPPEYLDLRCVFSKSKATSLPPHRPYDCSINLLPGSTPPKGRIYSLAPPEREAMDKYISESLAAGIIRPSSSPAGAGLFFVAKKDKSLRPCIDYRGLNEITVKNRYPLPLMSTAFELLQGAQFFTKLDLRNAYHLVRIKEGDEWKTAFNTPTGHYEYLVLPFGLTNAPAVFQALVNDVLRDFINRFAFVYLDDILIFSPTLDAHRSHVRRVLQRLLENQLFIKAEKCDFHQRSVAFLGFVISPGVVQMDPGKVEAVTGWAVPSSRRELQRFLGFANFYRKFVRNYSSVAAPLTALTSTKVRFLWNKDAESAFSTLKTMFTTAPVLAIPNPSSQFIVEVDASGTGVGAVLSQRLAKDNRVHPCAYFSRRLSPSEQNYGIGDRELLAIRLALEEWRHWLEGTETPFLIWTDHRNLEYLKTAKRLNSRQARWSLYFSRFNFVLSYRPASKNIKPDALSRLYAPVSQEGPETILPPHCLVATAQLHVETLVQRALAQDPGSANSPPGKLFVPLCVRTQVLQWGHSSLLACHPGIARTLSNLKQRFWWPTMSRDVKGFVAACDTCARSKTSNQPAAGLLRPLPIPHRPWSHIAVDFVTGLPPSCGNTCVMTIVDRFSKAAHFVPLPKLPSAKGTAELLVHHVFRLHGLPMDIVSDRGPQFTALFWKDFCRLIGASPSLSSGFHPQTNGQTERTNQKLEVALRCMVSENASSWSQWLPWIEYAHNSLPSSSTGLSPFQCCLGYQPPLFPTQEEEVAVPSVQAFVRRCRRVWARTRHHLLQAGKKYKKMADRRRVPAPAYRPGHRVMLSTANLPLKVLSRKLAPRFVGPFPVSKIINPCTVKLSLPLSMRRIHPSFHVSQLRPLISCPLSPPVKAPPPPTVIDGGETYMVRRLLKVRCRGRGLQYLVDWKGYGPEERCWVPSRFVLDHRLIEDFHRQNPEAPTRAPRGARKGGGTVTI